MKTITLTTTLTGPFFVFPASQADFANWDTAKRVELIGSAGRFSGSVNTTVDGPIFYVFRGATVPSAWSERIAIADFTLELAIDASAPAVWDQLVADHAAHNSFGAKVLIASQTQREVQVTGSNHVSASVHEMQADTLTASALASSAVAEIAAAVASATGTGARSVSITVRDSAAAAVQGALVRVSRTGESYSSTTNASGVVSFSLDDSTWTVSITATGFSFTPTSLVVDGNETVTYTLTTAAITPSPAGQTTGYWTVYDETGTIDPGAIIVMRALDPRSGSTGVILEDAVRESTANGSGVVAFSGLFLGAVYEAYRKDSTRKFRVTVPATAGSTVALGSIVG